MQLSAGSVAQPVQPHATPDAGEHKGHEGQAGSGQERHTAEAVGHIAAGNGSTDAHQQSADQNVRKALRMQRALGRSAMQSRGDPGPERKADHQEDALVQGGKVAL